MVMFYKFKEFLVIVGGDSWVRQGVFIKHMVAVEKLIEETVPVFGCTAVSRKDLISSARDLSWSWKRPSPPSSACL